VIRHQSSPYPVDSLCRKPGHGSTTIGIGQLAPLSELSEMNALLLPVNFSQYVFYHSKLQEDIFHRMQLVQTIFLVSYALRGIAFVLYPDIEVD